MIGSSITRLFICSQGFIKRLSPLVEGMLSGLIAIGHQRIVNNKYLFSNVDNHNQTGQRQRAVFHQREKQRFVLGYHV